MATALVPATGLVITPTPAAADATGNYIVVGAARRLVIRVANASGSPVTVTLDDVKTGTPESATAFNPDVTVSVPATTGVRYITLAGAKLDRFRNAATDRVSWTYSAATSVTVEVVSL